MPDLNPNPILHSPPRAPCPNISHRVAHSRVICDEGVAAAFLGMRLAGQEPRPSQSRTQSRQMRALRLRFLGCGLPVRNPSQPRRPSARPPILRPASSLPCMLTKPTPGLPFPGCTLLRSGDAGSGWSIRPECPGVRAGPAGIKLRGTPAGASEAGSCLGVDITSWLTW